LEVLNCPKPKNDEELLPDDLKSVVIVKRSLDYSERL
jgi:hypothetical protein